MNSYVFMDQESNNRQWLLDFFGLPPPRNGRDDHVCPEGHHGRHNEKYRQVGYNLMNTYVFMDLESKIRQWLLNFLGFLP